ncbi:integrase [Vibrio splendidus]|nr:integrase domain-containing protein [Vibrio splendidus]PTP40457.1 integrase [Vibrio splendidus]
MKTASLSATQVKQSKPKDKDYELSDGRGLNLRVRKNGGKSWAIRYKNPENGKPARFTLGTYPALSLADARKKALDCLNLIERGINPKTDKEQKQAEIEAVTLHTLKNVCAQWFEKKRKKISPDYAQDIWRSFELHAFPKLGKLPISKINAPDTINALRPMEVNGNLEALKRTVQRLNEVMTFAVNTGLIHANPLAGIKEAFDTPKKQNMATLKPEELPALMQSIAQASIKRLTRCLIEWQLHTMTRPSEASGARWEEIDFDESVWIIPAERMKKRKEHRVPLTNQMLAILDLIKPLTGFSEFVFMSASDPKKPMNSQTANMALKRMGFAGKLHAHGLRSLASTTLNEQRFDSDLIEAALAHNDKNEVRATYNRTDYLERQRPMMQWWSDHISECSQGSFSVCGTKSLKVIGND